VIPECSGLKSGWLKGRKGSVEGWFPEDFVMPVLSESSEPPQQRADELETKRESAADYSNVTSCQYSNLPAQ